MARLNKQQLEARKKAIEQEIKDKQAEKLALMSQISKKTRAEETRRKIIVGSFYLARAHHDDRARAAMLKELGGYLTREDDRKLFGLPPIPEKPAEDVARPATAETSDGPPPMLEDASRAVAH